MKSTQALNKKFRSVQRLAIRGPTTLAIALSLVALVWTTMQANAAPPVEATNDDTEASAPASAPKKDAGVTAQDDLPTPHLSYGRLPTYSGIVIDWGLPTESTVFFDAAKYNGHLDYVVRALSRRITARRFLVEVSVPKARRYFPFLLYALPNELSIHGDVVNYVVRPQRYRFQDSHEAIASVLKRVIDRIDASTQSRFGRGAAMLYDGDRRRPNAKSADAFAKLHVPSIGLRVLLEKVGGTRVEILHPGTAVGRLVRIPAGKEPKIFGPDIIAVYDAVPDIAPAFAGVITLEAQTPLSHLNLLAMNRGTVNLSALSIDDIDGLAANIGHPVRLVATLDDGRGGQLTIRRLSSQEFEREKTKARKKLELPRAKVQYPRVLTLGEGKAVSTYRLVRTVGAKAVGYDRLRRVLGDDVVRKASALNFGAYHRHVRQSGARKLVVDLVKNRRKLSRELTNARLAIIREAILNTPLDKRTLDLVHEHIRTRYGESKVRLRSSTNCEDLPAFNGAGLYLSKGLKQKNRTKARVRKKLDTKLRAVFASLWSEHAFWEREFAGIDQREPAMAILIHAAFTNEWGDGVALTISQVMQMKDSGKRRVKVLVQAQRGGGGVTHPRAGQTAESFVWTKGRSVPGKIQTRGSEGAVLLDDNPQTRAEVVKFLERMMVVHAAFVGEEFRRRDFVRSTTKLRKRNGRKRRVKRRVVGVDVEFKVMRENKKLRIYFKQARLLSTPTPRLAPTLEIAPKKR